MKYTAEYVRMRMGGSYELAVKVYAAIATIYPLPTEAPAAKWETAMSRINRQQRQADKLCERGEENGK